MRWVRANGRLSTLWYRELACCCPLWARQQAEYERPERGWGAQASEYRGVTPWLVMSHALQVEAPAHTVAGGARLRLEFISRLKPDCQPDLAEILALGERQFWENLLGVEER